MRHERGLNIRSRQEPSQRHPHWHAENPRRMCENLPDQHARQRAINQHDGAFFCGDDEKGHYATPAKSPGQRLPAGGVTAPRSLNTARVSTGRKGGIRSEAAPVADRKCGAYHLRAANRCAGSGRGGFHLIRLNPPPWEECGRCLNNSPRAFVSRFQRAGPTASTQQPAEGVCVWGLGAGWCSCCGPLIKKLRRNY